MFFKIYIYFYYDDFWGVGDGKSAALRPIDTNMEYLFQLDFSKKRREISKRGQAWWSKTRYNPPSRPPIALHFWTLVGGKLKIMYLFVCEKMDVNSKSLYDVIDACCNQSFCQCIMGDTQPYILAQVAFRECVQQSKSCNPLHCLQWHHRAPLETMNLQIITCQELTVVYYYNICHFIRSGANWTVQSAFYLLNTNLLKYV